MKAGVKRESLNGVKVDCLLLAVKVIHSFTMLGNWFRVTVYLDFQRLLHWSGTRTYTYLSDGVHVSRTQL